jgi:hypothetical protein
MGMGEESGVSETPVAETKPIAAPAPVTEAAPEQAAPVVAETTTTEPVVETPPVVEAPAIVEPTVVEKIVEKYPEFKDESAKELYERFVNGDTDAVYNYLTAIKKDYGTMSHLDVVREGLADKNPGWTKQDIELEIRAEYGQELEKYNLADIDKELEPDEYKAAVAHNEKVDANTLRLERHARDFRIALKDKQKTIELPKISKEEAPAPAAGPTQAEIDELKLKWANDAQAQVPNLTDFKFQVGDSTTPEEVVFAVTPEEKAQRVEAMKTWTGADFMKRRGWQNEDGSFNLLKIAEDEHALENIAKVAKSAYTQGLNKGKKGTVAEIKNIDLEPNRQNSVASVPADAGDLVWG